MPRIPPSREHCLGSKPNTVLMNAFMTILKNQALTMGFFAINNVWSQYLGTSSSNILSISMSALAKKLHQWIIDVCWINHQKETWQPEMYHQTTDFIVHGDSSSR